MLQLRRSSPATLSCLELRSFADKRCTAWLRSRGAPQCLCCPRPALIPAKVRSRGERGTLSL